MIGPHARDPIGYPEFDWDPFSVEPYAWVSF
jgi:hypothetical protein